MLAILSPAKTLDFESKNNFSQHTHPEFIQDSSYLVDELKQMSSEDISNLMKISSSLGELNIKRFKSWNIDFNNSNARQSILCFKGGVYIGLDIDSFSEDDLLYSQNTLRILSGLHGLLKPLDLIKPYRLEMGTSLKNKNGKNLYDFWGNKITDSLNSSLENSNSNFLLNLASNEYFKSINDKKIKVPIINVKFLDKKKDTYKIISFFAKKARGAMAAFVIKNKIRNTNDLKDFNSLGYVFDDSRSEKELLVFTR